MSIEPSEVLADWNSTQGPFHQIRQVDLEWNLRAQDRVVYKAVALAGVRALLAVASETGAGAGIPRGNVWLSLWGAIPAGNETKFIESLEAYARENKLGKIVIGGDEFHFVPGVPLGTPSADRLVSAFNKANFETAGDVADFVGDLASAPIQRYVAEGHTLAVREGWSLDPLRADDQEELRAFLAKEFPGRWTREFEFWRDRQDTRGASWSRLRREGVTQGFARMAIRSANPEGGWTPGALRLPLKSSGQFDVHDSCLGPIGVAISGRGQGAGRVLLSLVLEHLTHNKARHICIDWTNAFKYYEPLQLDRARTHWTAWKVVSPA